MYDFIHIGYGKCMSTSLQTIWGASENYRYSKLTPLCQKIDEIVISHAPDEQAILRELDRLPKFSFTEIDPAKINILSEEGITYSFNNNPDLGRFVLLKQKALARILAAQTRKVLVVVRDPVAWLASAYAQNIREGGVLSDIGSYIEKFGPVLMSNLNLRETISFWEEFGVSVHVVPMDLPTEAFWEEYARLQETRPSAFDRKLSRQDRNATRKETLGMHVQMNRLVHHMDQTLRKHDYEQKNVNSPVLEFMRLWGNRIFCDHADESELELMADFLKPLELDMEVRLNRDMADAIQRDFVEVVAEKLGERHPSIVALYERNLASAAARS